MNTYLVQRLNAPLGNKGAEIWSFGGGLKNGGLSENAMNLLRPIFSFDYMGSAEFEFGAVSKSFDHIAKNIATYDAWECNIQKKKIYIISQKEEKEEVKDLLSRLAKGKEKLKGSSHFDWALGLNKWLTGECKTIGWLDLENNLLFFIDKDAAEKTAQLFELTFNYKSNETIR